MYYIRGMRCPRCHSEEFVRDGVVKGKQRYLCKVCRYHYTVAYRGKPPELKRAALQLYLEGLGFRSIERFLKVSNVTVMNWIKGYGKRLEEIRREEGGIDIIEMDEMHSYLLRKKAIVGFGWLLIGYGKGSSISCWVAGERRRDKGFGTR